MLMFRGVASFLMILLTLALPARADTIDDLYTAQAIVSGTDEARREAGFQACLERVLMRVSGDQTVLALPQMQALRRRAGRFVKSFSYRDRLAGLPVHDEQGTYDRPYDLTCRYERPVVDGLLGDLGRRPWLDRRPTLAVFLEVQRGERHYRANSEKLRDQAMRESFAQAASLMAMSIVFPTAKDSLAKAEGSSVLQAARKSRADLPLVGTLVWSDRDLGWVATWRLRQGDVDHHWQVKGVNFDEAFRVAMRGAAQILSGNGRP